MLKLSYDIWTNVSFLLDFRLGMVRRYVSNPIYHFQTCTKLFSNLHSEIPIMSKNVLECGSENVFVFLRDVLSKPSQYPQTQCIVDGSTRQTWRNCYCKQSIDDVDRGTERGLCHPIYLGGKWVPETLASDLVALDTWFEDSLYRFRCRWPEVRAKIHSTRCNFWSYLYISIALVLYLTPAVWLIENPAFGRGISYL